MMILHMGISIWIQRSLFAYRDLVNYNPCMHTGIHWCPYSSGDCNWQDPCMHTGIYIYPHLHTGIDLDPRMHTGIAWQMHTGIEMNPCMRTGIDEIPVCIRGLCVMQSLYAYGDLDLSLYAYGGLADLRMHTGIARHQSPHAYGDLVQSPYV